MALHCIHAVFQIYCICMIYGISVSITHRHVRILWNMRLGYRSCTKCDNNYTYSADVIMRQAWTLCLILAMLVISNSPVLAINSFGATRQLTAGTHSFVNRFTLNYTDCIRHSVALMNLKFVTDL